MTSMEVANGTSETPSLSHFEETPELNQSVKRKRDESDITKSADAPLTISTTTETATSLPGNVQEQITDYVEVLKSYDTGDGIVTRAIPELGEEPPAKRKKADAEVDSIYHRASSGIYSSLNHVLADVKDVCSSVLEGHKAVSASDTTDDHNIVQNVRKIASIQLFRKQAEDLLSQEQMRDEWKKAGRMPKSMGKNATTDATTSKTFTTLTSGPEDSLLALTLLSNTPSDSRSGSRQGPRQLFSSIKKASEDDGGKELPHLLRELALPPNITYTQICPTPATIADSKVSAQTLGELCTTKGASLPTYRSSHVGQTKGNIVSWYRPGSLEEYPRKHDTSYSSQTVAVGQWLNYEGTPRQGLARKRVNVPVTDEDKLDRSFRNAFNSFAPTRDDTAAIVPQAVLSRMHWQKRGERCFRQIANKMETAVAILDPVDTADSASAKDSIEMPVSMNGTKTESATIEDGFEDVVDFVNQGLIDPQLEMTEAKSIHDKDVEEVLRDISELLETFNSYQRNRHLRPASSRLSEYSTIEKPNEIEVATYNTLKAQLAFMIKTLPPYAVAKLNSDKLAALHISTKIPVHTINHKGVMDEDAESQRIRAADMAARSARVAPMATASRPSSSQALYGNQYSGASRTNATVPQSTYYNQTPVRPQPARAPVSAQPFVSRTTQPSYHGSSTSQYTGASYPHQQARQPPMSYGSTYYNTPSTQSYNQPATYANSPMTAPQAGQRYPATTSGYQPRPTVQPVRQFSHNDSISTQHNSPQKTTYSPQPIPTPLSRSYGTPTPATAPLSRDYYATSAALNNNPQVYAQSAATSQGGEVSGFKTYMNSVQQSALLDRQRAQIAQQQQESLYRSQATPQTEYVERPVN